MLGFIQNRFGQTFHPIGVDIGSSGIRLAQVQSVDGDHRLIAAGAVEVQDGISIHSEAGLTRLTRTISDLLTEGKFRGRSCAISLPSSAIEVAHLRLPVMNEAETRGAIRATLGGKLGLDIEHAYFRHLVVGAGETVEQDQNEILVLACPGALVDSIVEATRQARLDVVGLTAPQIALLDCFQHVYRRQLDRDTTSCYIDLGYSGTRISIARGSRITHIRNSAIGIKRMITRLSMQLNVTESEAAAILSSLPTREREMHQQAHKRELSKSAHDGASLFEPEPEEAQPGISVAAVKSAIADCIGEMTQNIREAIAYNNSLFPSRRTDRLIFVGGGAQQRGICQDIAKQIGLSAIVGDPLVRMCRTSASLPSFSIDRRQPQPAWAVAVGLGLGAPVERPVEVGR